MQRIPETYLKNDKDRKHLQEIIKAIEQNDAVMLEKQIFGMNIDDPTIKSALVACALENQATDVITYFLNHYMVTHDDYQKYSHDYKNKITDISTSVYVATAQATQSTHHEAIPNVDIVNLIMIMQEHLNHVSQFNLFFFLEYADSFMEGFDVNKIFKQFNQSLTHLIEMINDSRICMTHDDQIKFMNQLNLVDFKFLDSVSFHANPFTQAFPLQLSDMMTTLHKSIIFNNTINNDNRTHKENKIDNDTFLNLLITAISHQLVLFTNEIKNEINEIIKSQNKALGMAINKNVFINHIKQKLIEGEPNINIIDCITNLLDTLKNAYNNALRSGENNATIKAIYVLIEPFKKTGVCKLHINKENKTIEYQLTENYLNFQHLAKPDNNPSIKLSKT